MEDWCRRFIADNGLNAEMRGFVSNDEVLALIAESRGALMPTQCYESFPMGIVEAYSAGTPVICSDFGNAGALVEEGVTGFKFRRDDAGALAQAVGRLAGNEAIHASTFSVYRENYTAEKNYSELMAIYECVGAPLGR